ncbi:hypothetical protein KJ359_008960 [Pestalotiopsis sp. 9143b]|nr:hypothetical protein KJ359_008960 [Pestalotiopsis sp. 9143b]
MDGFRPKQERQSPGVPELPPVPKLPNLDLSSLVLDERPAAKTESQQNCMIARGAQSAAAGVHEQLHRKLYQPSSPPRGSGVPYQEHAGDIRASLPRRDIIQHMTIRRKPVGNPRSQIGAAEPMAEENKPDPFEFLKIFDTIFLIDDSTSIAPYSDEVMGLIRAIVPLCVERDTNGVDIYFANHTRSGSHWHPGDVRRKGYRHIGIWSAHPEMHDNVEGIFNDVKPTGKHGITDRLIHILKDYVSRFKKDASIKPINVIAVTARPFSDRIGQVSEIARRLDRVQAPSHQVGIQFFQIGDDEEVREQMRFMDNDVHEKYGHRDIMDTATWTDGPGKLSAEGVLKVVGGAVSRSLDGTKLTELRMPDLPALE